MNCYGKAKPPPKKLIILAIFGLVALYVGMSPPVWTWAGLYDKFMFFPVKEKCDISEISAQIEKSFHTKVENVSFNASNGTKLHGYFCKLPGTSKVMLYSHGNGGNIDYRLPCAASLMGLGCSVLLYDYEGYGASGGTPTLANICDDAVCAFDFLEKREHYRPKDIVLYGESLGTGVSCELSKRKQCGGIILMSGFASLIEAGKDRLAWLRFYPNCLFPEPNMDNLATLSQPHEVDHWLSVQSLSIV